MKKKLSILFLTTSNLATNPRLVKEIELAIQLGYHVSVICFSFNNWSRGLNDQIIDGFASSIKLKEIPAGKNPFIPWLLSSFFQQLNKFFLLPAENNLSFFSFALTKRTWLLNNELKKKRKQVDLIVAHNPGSIYPAYVYSKKMKIPFGIDIEDYHPGETNHAGQSAMMRKLMQVVLPTAAYVTAASPLILEKVKEDCKGNLNWSETILNYFDSNEFLSPVSSDSRKLQLVWFSQYIDAGRGLEKLIETVKVFIDEVELHLYGNLNESFYKNYLRFVSNVVLHPAVPQKELHQKLANYDVGVAAEDSSANFNRDICLTNKLLSYYQAGLYILVSDTSAQKQFIQQHPEHGIITTLQRENLKNAIQDLIEQKVKLRQTAKQRFEKARSTNSESELKKISIIWSSLKKNTL